MVVIDQRKVESMADLFLQIRPSGIECDGKPYQTWVAAVGIVRAYVATPQYVKAFDAHFSDADRLAFLDQE